MSSAVLTPHPNAASVGRFRRWLVVIAIAYVAIIALVLYPALHEGFGFSVTLWNCIPPTLGLLVVISAFGKSRYRVVISTIFASITAATAIFFSAAWFFTALDTDPHSFTTKLVFVYVPVISITIAGLGALLGWLATTTKNP